MVCFVPIVCLSIRKSCQRRDCSELGNVRNWVERCILRTIWSFGLRSALFSFASLMISSKKNQNNLSACFNFAGEFMAIQAKWWLVSTFD